MKLVSRLNVFADKAPQAASIAIHDTANFIISIIRLYAPVDTGFLRDSYQKQTVSQLNVIIGSAVFYAVHQEFGTSRQSGTPHLIPAFNQAINYYKKALAMRMKDLG